MMDYMTIKNLMEENAKLKNTGKFSGFMRTNGSGCVISSPVMQGINPFTRIPMCPPERFKKISKACTMEEYFILTDCTFESSHDTIGRLIDTLKRLYDDGVFDDVMAPEPPNMFGSMNSPIMNPTGFTNTDVNTFKCDDLKPEVYPDDVMQKILSTKSSSDCIKEFCNYTKVGAEDITQNTNDENVVTPTATSTDE